jgi:class 3 adenylate cyclase/tetratricopeptide (TPR) repeat protein
MLAAIGELAGEVSPAPKAVAAAEPKAQDAAERRQVTVMFSDLVGSTALSARMDPEDLREVISAYQKCVAETVQRFGGFVAKYMGDGVLVYFGYPQAHEDDAERAVRAGLELIQAVGGLKSSPQLQARVGIATGLVVVGDLIGSGAAQEQAVVGETPNIAARLQGIAEPNTVVIAESTRKLLGNLFELQDLGPRDLKGIAGPMRAWTALRAALVESRFEALHESGLTELVGREEELELLLRRWSKAKTGDGQVVLLSGEAGIGKSRLTVALLERLAGEPHTRLHYFCSPQRTDSALFPVISQMERAAGFVHDDVARTRLDKLDAMLAQTSTSTEDAALFAEMLSLPNDGRYPNLDLTPEFRRRRTLEALVSQMEALARQNPVFLIFEDAHWTDPTSLELFGRVIDRLRSLRVLLILIFRPDFEPPWMGRPYVTLVALNRLGEREIAAMIDGVVGNKSLPANIRQDIVERTDGIPLFVEEMTKAILEAGSEEAAERTATGIPSPALAVPASLQASLMARLDRLGPAKEVAQVGAAIGREFSHSLLASVISKSGADLNSALDRLIQAGLLFRHGMPPHAAYLFKHALVQDAAYGTLLRGGRQTLHARIAKTLESQFAEIAENQPELLARHCTEAGLIEKAVLLWGKAGQRSLERSALVEAIDQLTRALAQIVTLPATPALRRDQITFQVALITPLAHVKGFNAAETKAAVEQARRLIEQAEVLGESPEDPLLLFSVLHRFWLASFNGGNGDVVLDLAGQFLALAEKQGATVPLMMGHGMMGASLVYIGDLTQGLVHFDRTIALYDSARHRPPTLPFRSITLWMLGYPEAALGDADQALKNAREIGQAARLMFALGFAGITNSLCGDYAAATALFDELVDLADQKNVLPWRAAGMAWRGSVFAMTGRAAEAVQIIASGLTSYRSTGAKWNVPSFLYYLALAYAELGQFENFWRCIGEATTTLEINKERWWEAEVNRLSGEIARRSSDDPAKAVRYFEQALSIARRQQARSWELRAAMSMARLWRDQGKRDEARELLAPVYGWFTEGFDTRDLKEARTLLEELSS